MAGTEKIISAKFVVDGEKEFKAAISSINSELKNAKSALELVEQQYKGQEMSTEALTAKLDALSTAQEIQQKKTTVATEALEEAQKAQQKYAESIEATKAEIEQINQRMAELGTSSGDTSDEMKQLSERQKQLSNDLISLESGYERANKTANVWGTTLNKSKTEEEKLKHAISQTNEQLHNQGNAIDMLSRALAARTIQKGANEIAEALKQCVEASIEFESAITGVFKTVDGTDEQLAAISDGIKEMATRIPATTTEIASVAEAAGQLGIQTDSVLSFTEVMINLGNATNLSADEAATALARFANITGMSADEYDRLGSTIVALGNNFATTESEITNLATRLASAGQIAGLSEPEILALSAAMSSVGIAAEAGGTAMTQTLTAIANAAESGGDELQTLADIAGMSASEFKVALEQDAMSAISAFISGIAELNETGGNVSATLEELGMSGVRQSNMIRSLALANDMFAESVDMANKAWEENTALTEEAEKRYATTESKLQTLNNAYENLKVTLGDQLKPALDKLAEAGTSALVWVNDFAEKNPEVVRGLEAVAVAATVVGAAIGAWALLDVTGILSSLTAINATLAANPAGIVALAIAGLVAAIATLALTAEETKDEYVELGQAIKESREIYQETTDAIEGEGAAALQTIDRIERLAAIENKSELRKQQLADAVAKLNEQVPGLNAEYDALTDTLNMTADAMRNFVNAATGQQQLEADAQRATELEGQIAQLYEQRAIAEKNLEEAKAKRQAAIESTSRSNRKNDTSSSALQIAQTTYDNIGGKIERLIAEYEALTGEVYGANKAIAASGDAVAENVNKISEASKTVIAEAQAELVALMTQYDEMYAKNMETVEGIFKTFDAVEKQTAQSVATTMDALQSQIDYFAEYAENMAKAAEMGLSDGLITALSDGSEESAAILAGIVEDGGEKIEELNEKFAEVQESKEILAQTMTEAQSDFEEQCNAIIETAENMVDGLNLSEIAQKAGYSTAEAYISGLYGGLSAYASGAVSAVGRSKNGGTTEYNTTVNVTSPQRLSPSEIARETKNSLKVAVQNAR